MPIVIAFSANLDSDFGNPPQTFMHAIKLLKDTGVLTCKGSSLWLTAPVPVSGQPWYHNAVAEVQTDKNASEMLKIMKEIEQQAGRTASYRNAPRPLDLDLIAYNDQIIKDNDDLIVPHPRMHERAFVLFPMREVAPQWIHPVLNKSVEALGIEIPPTQDVKKLETNVMNK